MSAGLHNLVVDWGGFEKFVAELHDTGDFEIERNVELPARAGGTYEIDVLLTSRAGPYVYKTIVSCKYWKSNVTRTAINDLIQARDQVGAQKAICFTSSGFQDPSAVSAARAAGIDLFVVKDLLPEDWGSPKIITFVLQLFQAGAHVSAVNPIDPVDPVGTAPPADWLDSAAPQDVEVLGLDGTPNGTLGERAEKLISSTWAEFRDRRATYSGGVELSFSQAVNYENVVFDAPRLLRYRGCTARVEKLQCGVAAQIHQRPVVVDRSRAFDFAVVVEDYLNERRTVVSRRPGAQPNWEATRNEDPSIDSNDVVRSDTLIVAVRLQAPLPHDEVLRMLRSPVTNGDAA